MSRRLTYCPSPRTPLAPAASPVHRWIARLAPLAVVALLGCGEDKPDALGIGDEMETADATAADETAADETADPATPDDDPLARLATECEQRFSCGCASDRFADVAACEEHYKVDWAGIAAKAETAGLTADFECYMRGLPYEAYGCDSYSEYAEDMEPQACSICQPAYGDRKVGETCQDFGGGVADCAQGLLCLPSPQGDTQCIDLCTQAGPGESCNWVACEEGLFCDWLDATCRPAGGDGELCADGVCDDGLFCDWTDMTCHAAGGAGELCADGVCDDGLVCDWLTNTCKQGVGLGEACDSEPCASGLFCGDNQVCATLAGQGESCATAPCAVGLVCRWDDTTCDVPGQAGDGCVGVECASGLFCDTVLGTCAPPGSVGDPCLDRPCIDGLTCDYQTMKCATFPELGEPCSDVCADGLLCNYDVSPAVCATLPVGGEPCVYENCAANFICDFATHQCIDEPPILCNL